MTVVLLAEILYIAQDSAITNSPFGRQQTVHERDSLAVTDDVNCKDLREQRRRHFKCTIKVPIRVICQPTQPLVRSKHNGTIYFRNCVGSYETLLIIGASVREDVGQVF